MSDVHTESSASSVTTRQSLEKIQNIDLIGKTAHQITGAKLPSNRQVMQVFFHNMRFVYQNKLPDDKSKNSAKLAIDATKVFWHQARIPVREDHKCVAKVQKMYENWMSIRKTREDKRSKTQKQIAQSFIDSLDDLFDIASKDALDQIQIEEDKIFLEMQRKKGRPGAMVGVDMTLYGREQRSQARKEKENARKRKHEEEISQQRGNTAWLCSNILYNLLC